MLRHIPQALDVHKAHQENDRIGCDLFVQCRHGRHVTVDCKIRSKDFARQVAGKGNELTWINDDYALEIWSVKEQQVVGWTRDPNKITDYVLWYWVDTQRIAMLPFSQLYQVFHNHWEQWSEQYGSHTQFTPDGNYHSECVFVPRHAVWKAIYLMFSGQPCPF